MKQNCIISRLDNPEIAQLFEIDIDQNLINNLRVLCTKYQGTIKYFIPEALFHDIIIGKTISITAEAYDKEKKILFPIQPLSELRDQLNRYGVTEKKEGIINEIRIKIDGYELPKPNQSLIPLSTSNLARIQEERNIIWKSCHSYNFEEESKGDSRLQDRSIERKQKQDRKNKLREIAILSGIAAIAIIILALIIFLTRDTSVSKVTEAINQGNYKWAVEIYNDSINGHESREADVSAIIFDTIQRLRDRFFAGQSSFQETCEALQAFSRIQNSEISEAAENALLDVQLQKASSALYTKGTELMNEHDYCGAIEAFLDIDEDSLYYNEANEQINECINQLVTDVKDLESQEACLAALDRINSVLLLLPTNTELQSYKSRLEDSYFGFIRYEAIETAAVNMAEGDFKKALSSIDAALKTIKDDPVLLAKRSEHEDSIRNYFISRIDQFTEKNDYITAFAEIKTALGILPKDKAFEGKQEECQQRYVEYITALAQEMSAAGEYEAALNLISEAIKTYKCAAFDTLFSETEAAQLRAIEEAKTKQVGTVEFITYSASIDSDDEEDLYSLIAPEDGYYRFTFSDIRNGFTLFIRIYGPNNELICSENDRSNGSGVTCQLSKNKEYTITIGSYLKTGDYTLSIGQPKATIDISSYEVIHDSIEYRDQENKYYFTPQIDGIYRFSFTGIVSGYELRMSMYDQLGYLVNAKSELSNNGGFTVELNAGEAYSVVVEQYKSVGVYQLNIGKQQPTEDISGKTTVEGEIQFISQQNVYTYTASSTGKYRFTVKDTINGFSLKMNIYDDLGYYVAGDIPLQKDDYIFADMERGKTYTIYVTQCSSIASYKIFISRE